MKVKNETDVFDLSYDEIESIVDFKYLKPTEENLNKYKSWLQEGKFTLKDIENTELYTSWDIREDKLEGQDLWYYLELFYWAMAYGIKTFPEEYTADVNTLDMLNREKYDICFEDWKIILTKKQTCERIVLSNYGPPREE